MAVIHFLMSLPDFLTIGWHHIVNAVSPDIIAVPADRISDAMRDALLANGGHGVQRDAVEAIYIDRTSAVQSCFTDAECQYVSTVAAVN